MHCSNENDIELLPSILMLLWFFILVLLKEEDLVIVGRVIGISIIGIIGIGIGILVLVLVGNQAVVWVMGDDK